MRRNLWFFVALILWCSFALLPSQAQTLAAVDDRLESVSGRLHSISADIGRIVATMARLEKTTQAQQTQREVLLEELKQQQTQLRNTSNRTEAIQARLAEIEGEIMARRVVLAQQERRIATVADRLYREILLPAEQTRYLRDALGSFSLYLSENRENLRQLEQFEKEYRERLSDYHGSLDESLHIAEEIALKLKEIEGKLQQYQRTLRASETQLKALYGEKQSLEEDIAVLFETKKRLYQDVRDFSGFKGVLEPPATGKVQMAADGKGVYFSPRNDGRVYCIFDGEVVYRGAIPKYGSVLIVDHGGSYFSVYGGLVDILVQEGDKVYANELLGSSLRLYFEIRHRKETLDPRKWMKLEEL
ncbi:murein hydrolase activator EnvC family protein [Chrysiogenes arsenatis]|uniref:murein hydrolase activator EnvC family protein n=1 Tax=Chrysiogenes arsenatis TaxID=309797 RepID=UPI000409AFC7|nr:peptidoglycan DD-metalloendopeptidase family protein [Chrysiogenes arsenatis]